MQPGVSIQHEAKKQHPLASAAVVPVFIGFTAIEHYGLQEVSTWQDFTDLFGSSSSKVEEEEFFLSSSVQYYLEHGGGHCFVYSVGSMSQALKLDENELSRSLCQAVFAAIVQEPRITVLSVPDLALLSEAKAGISALQRSWLDIMAFLHQQGSSRPLFAVLDAPNCPIRASALLQSLQEQNPPGAAYSAAYWPLLIWHTSGGPLSLSASAAAVATLWQTDRERGAWKAPANTALSPNLELNPPLNVNVVLLEQVEQRAINVLRHLPGRGVRVWGCRTLAANHSPWKYVQTRRLVSEVETNLREIGRFALFEPNNEITWFKLAAFFNGYLRKLWQRGGLQGATDDEAFHVRLGLGVTMTADDVRNGVLRVDIGLAVSQPAEFIMLTLLLQQDDSMDDAAAYSDRQTSMTDTSSPFLFHSDSEAL